jgi:hypothetical protein
LEETAAAFFSFKTDGKRDTSVLKETGVGGLNILLSVSSYLMCDVAIY